VYKSVRNVCYVLLMYVGLSITGCGYSIKAQDPKEVCEGV